METETVGSQNNGRRNKTLLKNPASAPYSHDVLHIYTVLPTPVLTAILHHGHAAGERYSQSEGKAIPRKGIDVFLLGVVALALVAASSFTFHVGQEGDDALLRGNVLDDVF